MPPLPTDRFDAIARTVHDAVRAWAIAHGQLDIPAWDDAPDWMQASTRESIAHALENGGADGRSQHAQWLAQKQRDGWRYGSVKDAGAKTHPLMIPYDDLPDWERRKDRLINAIAKALA